MPKSRRSTAFTTTGGPFDACLSGLTPGQSQRVRELAHHALAERGLETTIHDHHLEALDGRTFGLDGIGSVCHAHPEAAWPELVAGHIEAITSAFPGDAPPELSAADIRAHVHVRLVPLGEVVPDDDNPYTYAPRLGAGFAELLVHKDGDMVRWLTDEDVAKVGADELYALGRERLRLIRPDVCEILRRNGGEIYVARGDSGFIASKLLLLPEVLRIVLGPKVRYPDGVLVAVPCRHELVFAPVGADVVPALAAVVDYTVMTFNHGLRPLSPYAYWWRDGTVTPLITIDRTGFVDYRLPPEFVDAVTRLSNEVA
jgi:hypothetical protein